jgi:phosphohistidine phosphatase
MMQLTLIRHAKSDWENEALNDIDRHLNARGYDNAYTLSEWYVNNQIKPDLIISSSATRALSTALIFARTLNYNITDLIIEPEIYESTSNIILSVINRQNNLKKSILLFGHNPSLTNFSNEICNNLFLDNIPTCGIISINFETDSWKNISPQNSSLNFHKFPKEY